MVRDVSRSADLPMKTECRPAKNCFRRFISRLCGCLLLIALFSPPGGSEETTIRFWYVGEDLEARMYRRMAEDFKQSTGIQVIVQPVGWGNFQTKYLTAMAAGIPPDAGITSLSGPAEYGRVASVIDLAEQFPEEIAQLQQTLFPNLWEGFYFQDRLFGIPFACTGLIQYYRKDIFQQLGIAPPSTWDELEEVVRVLEANDYKLAYDWTRDDGWAVGNFVWPLGVGRFTPDGRAVTWKDPRFVQGIQYAVRLWNTHNITSPKTDGVPAFASNEKGVAAPLFFDGTWKYHEIYFRAPEIRGAWSVAPLPKAPTGKRSAVMGGTAAVIFRESVHPRPAMQWLLFLLSKERQRERVADELNRGDRSTIFMSPHRETWQEPWQFELKDPAAGRPVRVGIPEEVQAALYEMMNQFETRPSVIGGHFADRALDRFFDQVRNEARNFIARKASARGMTVWDLHRAMAQGRHPGIRAEYEAFVNDYTRRALAEQAEPCSAQLARERDIFNRYYTHVLEQLETKLSEWDILDYAKPVVGVLLFAALAAVIFHPAGRKKWYCYLYLSPSLVILLVFMLIPILVSVYIAFCRYNPLLPLSYAKFIGLDNFRELLGTSLLRQSFIRSLLYAVWVIPLHLVLGMLFAAGLDKRLWPERGYKFLFFSPLVTSVVSVSLIWYALYVGEDYGWLNSLLRWLHQGLSEAGARIGLAPGQVQAGLASVGLSGQNIEFLGRSDTFLRCVIIMSVWQGLAFVILIYLAGLQNIPASLYEAAEIDGAGETQKFLYVTAPSLRPQVFFLLITGTIAALQVFEQIYMLGGGTREAGSKFGPDDSGLTLVPLIYRRGFEDFHMGEASAIAYVLFISIFLLTLLNWKLLLRKPQD